MSESKHGPIKIWKNYRFDDKYPSDIPSGETNLSGPCFRDTLLEAGILTDLPSWTRVSDIKAICSDLGLRCFRPEDSPATISVKNQHIIGYRQNPADRRGHFEYTKDIREVLQRVNESQIFAIIEIPSKDIHP